MKKILIIVLLLIISSSVNDYALVHKIEIVDIPNKNYLGVIKHIIYVESRGNDAAVNKSGAVGSMGIKPIMVYDINRIYHTNYTLEDRFDRTKSIEMFKLYVKAYHKNDSWDIIVMSWNQGIQGMYKYPDRAKNYLNKIKNQIKKHEDSNNRLYSNITYYSCVYSSNSPSYKNKICKY